LRDAGSGVACAELRHTITLLLVDVNSWRALLIDPQFAARSFGGSSSLTLEAGLLSNPSWTNSLALRFLQTHRLQDGFRGVVPRLAASHRS
jgi:hypothetical protein